MGTVMTTAAGSDESLRRIVREEIAANPKAAPQPNASAPPAHGSEVIERRQQAGKSFSWVYENERSYADWVVANAGKIHDAQLLRFRDYVVSRKVSEGRRV